MLSGNNDQNRRMMIFFIYFFIYSVLSYFYFFFLFLQQLWTFNCYSNKPLDRFNVNIEYFFLRSMELTLLEKWTFNVYWKVCDSDEFHLRQPNFFIGYNYHNNKQKLNVIFFFNHQFGAIKFFGENFEIPHFVSKIQPRCVSKKIGSEFLKKSSYVSVLTVFIAA